MWSQYTIDGLFDRIDEAIQNRHDSIDATYNPTFGFPIESHIDESFRVADDEFSYFVTSVQQLGTR